MRKAAEQVSRETPSVGRRIAELRNGLGWTQHELAERIGMSRNGLAQLEAGTVPSERTVALLAGIFKVEPHDLIAGTSYPVAKAERLPVVAARYTEVELQLRLLEHDLTNGARTPNADVTDWPDRLRVLLKDTHDRREQAAIKHALSLLER